MINLSSLSRTDTLLKKLRKMDYDKKDMDTYVEEKKIN